MSIDEGFEFFEVSGVIPFCLSRHGRGTKFSCMFIVLCCHLITTASLERVIGLFASFMSRVQRIQKIAKVEPNIGLALQFCGVKLWALGGPGSPCIHLALAS